MNLVNLDKLTIEFIVSFAIMVGNTCHKLSGSIYPDV